MRYSILFVAFLTGSFTISVAEAQNKVVVIPMGKTKPQVEVPDVTSAGQTWMALNLGASQVATSSDDPAAYGTLYQWGRFGDGHEYRSSPTTTVISNTNVPGYTIDCMSRAGRRLFEPDWRSRQRIDLFLSHFRSKPGKEGVCSEDS